ncbi:MAG: hypothetical protein JNM62_05405 [Flavobacteriales bacterium]|nr:hypothetical protein [Flavobacteriales bacterium]
MNETQRLVFAVVIITLVIVLMVLAMVALMVVNAQRRVRHSMDLAEADRQREREVMAAEREAVQQTLTEVGRELHDGVGHTLSVAQMALNTLVQDGPDPNLLAASREAVDQGAEEVRRLGRSLNSELWAKRSLADAISLEADRIQRVARVQVHVLMEEDLPKLPPDTNTVLFRVFQVILTNAMRHSGADRIDITIRPGGAQDLVLTIADNGMGFDPETTTTHAGLANIHKRSALIGYKAECITAPGGGCTWHLQPLAPHAA